jgi:hypothetical protein
MLNLKNGMYAKIPENFETEDLTPGKLYPIYGVNKYGSISFRISDDDGYERYCLLTGCSHISYGNWVIIEAVEINSKK